MSELHPVEAAWRRFRKSDRYELLAWARAARRNIRKRWQRAKLSAGVTPAQGGEQ